MVSLSLFLAYSFLPLGKHHQTIRLTIAYMLKHPEYRKFGTESKQLSICKVVCGGSYMEYTRMFDV